jgi:predicted nucleic acid-binding protein
MSADFFLDTNVFVYSFDEREPGKAERARGLIEQGLVERCGCTSWQVVQEFLNVALHKWEKPMSAQSAQVYVRQTLAPLCRVMPSPRLWEQAMQLHETTQFRWYDSLIVAAALESGAEVLYSEDLQDGRRLAGMTIRNPFS